MTLPRFYPGCECDCHTATGLAEAQPGTVCVECFCSAEFGRRELRVTVTRLERLTSAAAIFVIMAAFVGSMAGVFGLGIWLSGSNGYVAAGCLIGYLIVAVSVMVAFE